ncbi:MAG: peptide chain release factor N(5)-glutamine methyltransferase [Candidatus Marinimicrobia bacterium CG08_land_8_20_14_0_20_45_22]|nr:MAG: peptide chain release factor N(5)-glutamine methyltransferase [Candidatus Marinimicrobia bacterium CG08_land_8_20_14_0_20_45_22]
METISQKIWRVIDILKWSREYLSQKGIESPQIEVEWLLREILGCSRMDIYLNYDRPLSAAELADFKKMLIERASGKPIQYVVCKTEFMGLEIDVSPEVLIPRSDTEVIVEAIFSILKKRKWNKPRILDIGTGSGAIAVSLAVLIPECSVVACDISPKALEIARENARKHVVSERVDVILQDILKTGKFASAPFQVVVSNPPYVSDKMYDELPAIVKDYEPKVALAPGGDGLRFYHRFAELSDNLLMADGVLAVEIGGNYQEQAVLSIFSENGFDLLTVIKDLQGQSRGVLAEKKHE